MAASPTARTLAYLRREGWRCAIVEKWNPAVRRRHDLFGFVDVLAVRHEETLAVQVTSASNVASRLRKIREECAEQFADVRAAGWLVEVHGWRKIRNRWHVRVVAVT